MSRYKWELISAVSKPGLKPPFSQTQRAISVPKQIFSSFSPSPTVRKARYHKTVVDSPLKKPMSKSVGLGSKAQKSIFRTGERVTDPSPDASPLAVRSQGEFKKEAEFMPGILSEQARKLALIDCDKDIHEEIARLQRHIRSNSTASRRGKSLTLRQCIRPVTPYMEFEGLQMPTDLVILTQTRRRVIAEIRKQSIPGLVMSKLNEMKVGLMPDNMKNIEVASKDYSEREMQKAKNVKDMRSRSQFATTMYGLMALPKRSKDVLKETLVEVMPEGSRFTDDRLFK